MFVSFCTFFFRHPVARLIILFFFACGTGSAAVAQQRLSLLEGVIADASDQRPLFGASVSVIGDSIRYTTDVNGRYYIQTMKDKPSLEVKLDGYEPLQVSGSQVIPGRLQFILLKPQGAELSDSLGKRPVLDELDQSARPDLFNRETSSTLAQLNGVQVHHKPGNEGLQSVRLYGMGDRMGQVLINNAIAPEVDKTSRSAAFNLIPVELLRSVSVSATGDASKPGDYISGNLSLATAEGAKFNFFYVRAGSGFSRHSTGETFYGDSRADLELIGLTGNSRDLPGVVPDTRSQSSLDQKNPQQRVAILREMNNNLAPARVKPALPDTRLLFIGGKTFRINKTKIGITAYIAQEGHEMIDQVETQTVPSLSGNKYPYTQGDIVVASHSKSINYTSFSQVTAGITGTVEWAGNSVTWRTSMGHQLQNFFSNRSEYVKPDEDTLARLGIRYFTEDRFQFATQLAGTHVYGSAGKLRLTWVADYSFLRQQNPDERNFALRADTLSGQTFQLATQSATSLASTDGRFTNSGRLWRDSREHNFTGSVSLSLPYQLFGRSQSFSGGIYLNTRYRVLHSDLFLYSGGGYHPLDALLAPSNYFPGGLTATNFFTRVDNQGGLINPNSLLASNRGNYMGSLNTGAAYVQSVNKLLPALELRWGVRLESNSQLVSNIQYNYYPGFENPQTGTLDENSIVSKFSFLPSADFRYKIIPALELFASAFRSVNRPLLQELTAYRYYDPSVFAVRTGNQLLRTTTVENYSAGFGWQPANGVLFSATAYRKDLHRPIEYIVTGYAGSSGNMLYTPHNTAPGYVQGIRFAMRSDLSWIDRSEVFLKGVSVFANIDLLESRMDAGPVRSTVSPSTREHEFTNTPSRALNAGLIINAGKLPGLTMLYNYTGDYLSMLGSGALIIHPDGSSVNILPDYRMDAFEQLDLQLSQRIFRNRMQVAAGVKNLLNSSATQYQDLNGNKRFDQPLSLLVTANGKATYLAGTDNVITGIKTQRNFFCTISYSFK